MVHKTMLYRRNIRQFIEIMLKTATCIFMKKKYNLILRWWATYMYMWGQAPFNLLYTDDKKKIPPIINGKNL